MTQNNMEVVALVERLYRWRSETVNQWSDEYEPRTSWERQVSDAMKEWYEASAQAAEALTSAQAEIERLAKENAELRVQDGPRYVHAFVLRAEAAEKERGALREALSDVKRELFWCAKQLEAEGYDVREDGSVMLALSKATAALQPLEPKND